MERARPSPGPRRSRLCPPQTPRDTAGPRPGRLTYLSDADKTAIYEAALEIIGSIGMRVLHPEALELLRAAGCEVTEPDLVRIPRELVEKARSTAPAMIEIFDRAGEPAMSLGRSNSYFGTGSDLMSTYDLETGEHRPSALADVARAARLCDALPNIDFVMSCAHPNDIEPQRSYLESFKAMVANTTKPMVMTSEHAGDLAVMCAIAEALRGGPDELAAKPYFTMYLEPVSPLSHPVESIDKLLFCADHGIPAIYSPAPLAGGTAPITVAGHTCQGVAESLFGLVIHQLRKPGAPFLFGIGPAVLDMATSQSSYNAPEYLMTFLCQIEMARWLDLPNWGYGGTSDSQVVDAQAGMEIGELAFLCLAAGSNLNHDVGYLDFGLTASLELIVIVDEYIALNRKLFAGVEVTPETLAVDVVRDVGPGGDFLAHRHTAKNVRKAQWRPTIINRQGHVRWQEEGGLDLARRPAARPSSCSRRTQPAPLPAELAARIDALVDGFTPGDGAASPARRRRAEPWAPASRTSPTTTRPPSTRPRSRSWRTIGQRVHHPEALELLRAAGAEIVEPDLVKVPRELVEKARRTAPPVIEVYDRAGEHAMSLGRYNTYFGNGSAVTSVYDVETGEHRPTVLADGEMAARLCDALPHVDFVMAYAHPGDIDPHRRAARELPRDGQEHHQAAGRRRRERRRPRRDDRHRRGGARRRRGARRQAVLRPLPRADERPEPPGRQPRQAALLRRPRHPGDLLAGAAGRRHGADHHRRAASARAPPSRCSASSSTSCASRARRSSSASARRCSTWRRRRARTTRPST